MKNNWPIMFFLNVAIVALATLSILQNRQIQGLKKELAARPQPVNVAPAKGASALTSGQTRTPVPKMKEPLSGLPMDEPGAAGTGEAGETGAVAAVESPGEAPMTGLAKMMKNPGMKDMMRSQMKGQQDMMYGSLFRYLDLPEAELATFKDLLLDKQMALIDASMELMGGNQTPEERTATTQAIKDLTEDYNARIREFLGEDEYAIFQSYEETQPERMQVNLFKASLDRGNELTVEQEDLLIKSMHGYRTNFSFSVKGFGSSQVEDPSQLTPDMVAKLLEENAQLQDQYVAHASGILNPEQLRQFKENQKQHQAMMEMGMKMAASMFGKQSKPASPPAGLEKK